MKLIKYYEEQPISNVIDFLHDHSFGTLIFVKDGQNYATHAIFVVNKLGGEDNAKVYCHPSYDNPIVNEINNGLEVMCLFQGPSCYISPKWNNEIIPSWNYKTVHLKGSIRRLEKDELEIALTSIINKYEGTIINKSALEKDNSINITQLNKVQIAVFEIEISDCKKAFKLSQDKEEKEYLNIIRELKKQDDFNSMLIAFDMEQELKIKKRRQ